MLFEMRQVDQFEDWDGAICDLTTPLPAVCESDFAMLTCATNPLPCVASGRAVSRAADRHFSTSESLLVLVDCGGSADRCDLAGARSGDSATATRRSGASAAGHAVAGVRGGLRVRDPLVCRDLL